MAEHVIAAVEREQLIGEWVALVCAECNASLVSIESSKNNKGGYV